jgi:uncharacterized protein YozE (UPF0346 family)
MPAMISFYEWLSKQKLLRTPLGDFAREVVKDSGFPTDVGSMDALITYVRETKKSSAQTIVIARTAYRAYERSQRSAPSL